MKNATMAFTVFASAAAMAAVVPRVTKATFSQAGLRTVTINYTIADAPAIVTVDIQTNGISIGAQNFWNVEGDVNCRVDVGDHAITWCPHESWPNNYVPLTENGGARAVVTAWALDNPPDYIVAPHSPNCLQHFLREPHIPNAIHREDQHPVRYECV